MDIILRRALYQAGNACFAMGYEREAPVQQFQAALSQPYQNFQARKTAGTVQCGADTSAISSI